jgi:hypothetical protein
MAVHTRYRITDTDISDIKSFPVLTEIPYFLRHHRQRLNSIGNLVAMVSNRAHSHPTYVRLTAFHRHQTPYAAIDALAPPLAEFFEQTHILPIIHPIFDRFEERMEVLAPNLYRSFVRAGILISPEVAS